MVMDTERPLGASVPVICPNCGTRIYGVLGSRLEIHYTESLATFKEHVCPPKEIAQIGMISPTAPVQMSAQLSNAQTVQATVSVSEPPSSGSRTHGRRTRSRRRRSS